MMNKAYLTAGRDAGSDECLTPRYGVTPIVKHLKAKGYKTILCPFDKHDSFFVRVLRDEGFVVTNSHLEIGVDFFSIGDFSKFDAIVSNPPFSIKDRVLARLYQVGKPFAMILPQNSLQSQDRVKMFLENGLEYLGFDKRINYYINGVYSGWKAGNHFASAYFCKDVLSDKMVFEILHPIQEPYHA